MIFGAGSGASALVNFVPILLIFAVFYFIVIMPQKKQQQRKAAMIAALKKGDRVVTTGGIYGTVNAVEEQALLVKISENTKIRIAKNAIAGKVDSDGSVSEQ